MRDYTGEMVWMWSNIEFSQMQTSIKWKNQEESEINNQRGNGRILICETKYPKDDK